VHADADNNRAGSHGTRRTAPHQQACSAQTSGVSATRGSSPTVTYSSSTRPTNTRSVSSCHPIGCTAQRRRGYRSGTGGPFPRSRADLERVIMRWCYRLHAAAASDTSVALRCPPAVRSRTRKSRPPCPSAPRTALPACLCHQATARSFLDARFGHRVANVLVRQMELPRSVDTCFWV
jgi:hypothetical protein